MVSARHSNWRIFGLALVIFSSLAGPAKSQTPSAIQTELNSGDPSVDIEAVRVRVRDARRHFDRHERRRAYEAVVPKAERLVAEHPGPEASELLTMALFGARDDHKAQDAARLWVSQSPSDWHARVYLGMTLTATEDYEAALVPLERAMELASAEDHRRVARHLGFAFEKLRRFDDALVLYEEVGDEESADRVRANIETLASAAEIDPGIVCFDATAFEDEAERLEEELKALGFDG